MHESELKENKLEIGSEVYLVRKIAKDVVVLTLEEVGITDKPFVECLWHGRLRYKIDLAKNEVHSLDAKQDAARHMRQWYEVWEPHRRALMKLCEAARIDAKKNKRNFSWKK